MNTDVYLFNLFFDLYADIKKEVNKTERKKILRTSFP